MAAEKTIQRSDLESDIVLLTFDTPDKSANLLSQSVLDELAAQFDDLEKRSDLAGLILTSAKKSIFIAGADIREFTQLFGGKGELSTAASRRGQQLFQRLSKFPFVTVAAINGVCLGGGAELALFCDRRVLSTHPGTSYGFPEVKLGLYPAWGGASRLPRVIGLGNAVEMITGGEAIDAAQAYKNGLANDVAPPEKLLDAAVNMVRQEQQTKLYLTDREKWAGPIEISETELGFLGATASAMIRQQTKDQYPAPMAALELMLENAGADIDTALEKEAEGAADLFGSPVNKALVNVFFLTDRNKKDRGIERDDVQPAEIKTLGVVGAGIMGAGIAAASVKNELSVVLGDANESALAKGIQAITEETSYDRKLKGPSAERAIRFAPLLNEATTDAEFAACDLVIEAIVENADVKRQLYERIEPLLADKAILASNTSTIPITSLAKNLQRPEQFCGIHFFNPVRRMKLVEVIRGEKTSDETVVTAVAYAKRVGKSPIVVNDGPGFLVNRLLFPYMNESLELLCEGATIKEVDRAAKVFGMPMGPIVLYDMVGLDTALNAGRVMWEAFPSRIVASPLLPAMVKAGRLGQKSGAGFFNYQNKKGRPEPDPAADKIVSQYLRKEQSHSPEEITARLFLPMLLEATRLLEDGIVRDVRDVDLGLIFGLGFPPFRGGLLFWADSLGAAQIVEMLKPFEHLGERMTPTPLLLEMAKSGRKFYE